MTTFQQEQENLSELKAEMRRLLLLTPGVLVDAEISRAAFVYVQRQLELLNGPYVVLTKARAEAKGLDWAKISAKDNGISAN